MDKEFAIIKLGGSLITLKDKPLTANIVAMNIACSALSKSRIPVIIVHGGGSFGHFYAKKYGLDEKPSRALAEGVSKTRKAMLELNLKILDILCKYDLNPYPFPPSCFLERGLEWQRRYFLSLIDYGLTPITYGDVIRGNDGFFVLSGDRIIGMLTDALTPKRVVLLTDVDGVYRDIKKPDTLLSELRMEDLATVRLESLEMDVTGGMSLKLRESFEIARKNIDVLFVNGTKQSRIIKALRGEHFKGTLIRGVRE